MNTDVELLTLAHKEKVILYCEYSYSCEVSIYDVRTPSDCLTLTLAIADPYSHQCPEL